MSELQSATGVPDGWTVVTTPPVPKEGSPEELRAILSQKNPDAVTVGDIMADPKAAMQKIGAILKRDLSDPKTWITAAALYFGPKAANAALPVVARAASRIELKPSAALDFKVNQPFAFLKKAVTVKAAPAAAPEVSAPGFDRYLPNQSGASAPPAAPSAAPPAAAGPAVPASAPPPAPMSPAPVAEPPPAPMPKVAATASPKPHLTLEEFQAAERLMKEGYSKADVLKAIQQRKLPASWLKLPTDEEMAVSIQHRNETGKWRDQ